ncbi:DUF2442 domain-containing protein [Spirosoma areae]
MSRNIRRAHHSETVKYIRVVDAVYEGDYTVRVLFSDDTSQVINFGPFLMENPHPQYNKHRDIEPFKTFSVEMGTWFGGELGFDFSGRAIVQWLYL